MTRLSQHYHVKYMMSKTAGTIAFPVKLSVETALNLARQRAGQTKKIMWVVENDNGAQVLDAKPINAAVKHKVWPSGKIELL